MADPALSDSLDNRIAESLLDPVNFVTMVLGHKTWWTPARMLRYMLDTPKARMAVKACHASSKSFTAAEMVLAWLARFHDGKVITTAPVFRQVEKVLWAEIKTMIRDSDIAGSMFPVPLTTELRLAPDNYAIGMSTDEAVSFQGWHGKVLLIIDEAPGVPYDIFDAIEGVRAGGDVRVLQLGNPTIGAGPFYDAFTLNREYWETITISAFNTPNLRRLLPKDMNPDMMEDEDLIQFLRGYSHEELSENNPWPMLITPDWVLEKWETWGPGHPMWDARVMGRFPSQSEDALIPLLYIERAAREVGDIGGPLRIGIDVAGPGEAETVVTVLSPSRGIVATGIFDSPDPRGEVAAFLRPYKSRAEAINVDVIGMGWYFARHLEDLGYPVADIDVSKAPFGRTRSAIADAKDRYANLRSQLAWEMREYFESGDVGGVMDERLQSQLSTMKYKHDSRGRIALESKERMAKKGIQSPDRAESLMLAMANLTVTRQKISIKPFSVTRSSPWRV